MISCRQGLCAGCSSQSHLLDSTDTAVNSHRKASKGQQGAQRDAREAGPTWHHVTCDKNPHLQATEVNSQQNCSQAQSVNIPVISMSSCNPAGMRLTRAPKGNSGQTEAQLATGYIFSSRTRIVESHAQLRSSARGSALIRIKTHPNTLVPPVISLNECTATERDWTTWQLLAGSCSVSHCACKVRARHTHQC